MPLILCPRWRPFLQASGLLAAFLFSGVAVAQLDRNFPPPPPLHSPIEGAIDMHVHSEPDVFGRSLNDIETARLAQRQGMRAIVLKNHVTQTADRAALVSLVVPGIEVYGGIVLNRAVGGINPAAVEWMTRMSGARGKVVWLPTFDADHHLKTFKEPGTGLKVAIDGVVTPDTEAVLKIVARANLVLQTGHVSADEVMAVVRAARSLGVERVVVTHAMAEVPGLSIEQMEEAAALGATMELDVITHLQGPQAHLPWMTHWHRVSVADMAAAIKRVGADHFVLSTDLGQAGNPTFADGYAMLVTGLRKEGIADADVDRMMKRNPARLLGLEP